MRPGITLGFVTMVLLAHTNAWADEARQHFDEGKKRRDAGDCTGAVPEFEKSLASEKSIGAYYNLGYCHDQLGHRQDAYDAYKRGQELASSKKDERYREISGALAALLETPHIRLVLPQQLPDGFQIKVDDEVIPPSLYANETVIFTNTAKPHSVVATAPGYEERHETVENKQLRPIELHRAEVKEAMVPVPPAESKKHFTTGQWVGLGTLGTGIVGGLVLGGFAIAYAVERSDLDAELETSPCKGGASHLCEPGEPASEQGKVNDLVARNNDAEQGIRSKALAIGIPSAFLVAIGATIFVLARPAPERKTTTGTWYLLPRMDPRSASGTVGATFGGSF
jgi:hypothetical protein